MKKTGCRITIAVMIICMILVWPLGLLHGEQKYASGTAVPTVCTKVLTTDGTVRQEFTAQGTKLRTLSFYLSAGTVVHQDTVMELELNDEKGTAILKKTFTASQLEDSPQCIVTVNRKIKKGKIYSFTLRVRGSRTSDLYLNITPDKRDFAPGECRLMQNGKLLRGQARAEYVYDTLPDFQGVLLIWSILGMIGFSIAELFRKG